MKKKMTIFAIFLLLFIIVSASITTQVSAFEKTNSDHPLKPIIPDLGIIKEHKLVLDMVPNEFPVILDQDPEDDSKLTLETQIIKPTR